LFFGLCCFEFVPLILQFSLKFGQVSCLHRISCILPLLCLPVLNIFDLVRDRKKFGILHSAVGKVTTRVAFLLEYRIDGKARFLRAKLVYDVTYGDGTDIIRVSEMLRGDSFVTQFEERCSGRRRFLKRGAIFGGNCPVKFARAAIFFRTANDAIFSYRLNHLEYTVVWLVQINRKTGTVMAVGASRDANRKQRAQYNQKARTTWPNTHR
jgi:hypothetical protein